MMAPPRPWLRWLLGTVLVCVAGALLFLSAMDRDLNHDEHQFIAPGVLLSREGKLPYQDYPLFHLPNLVLVYAAMDRLSHDPVFSAKLVSVLSSTGLAALLVVVAATARGTEPPWRNIGTAALVLVLLLGDQLFVFTAGKTWNHELPAFLLVAGIILQASAFQHPRTWLYPLSGLCIGAAIGTRLTYAPVALVLPLLQVLHQGWSFKALRSSVLWLCGCLLGLGPSLYFLVAHREVFLFDNLEFPRLRLLDVSDSRAQKTATWWRKVRYFGKEIVTHSLPLFLAAAFVCWRSWKSRYDPTREKNYLFMATISVLPAALLGCFLPSRYQYQHFYVVIPLLVLLVAAVAGGSAGNCPWYRRTWIGILACAVLSMAALNADRSKRSGGIKAYAEIYHMLDAKEWFSNRLREDYSFVRGVHGPILTLAPAGVLQAGGTIYPEFATGPFAWRGAQKIDQEQRRRCKIIVPEDLEEYLAPKTPGAILTGVEDANLEGPILAYARQHGYRETKVGKKRVLWLPQ